MKLNRRRFIKVGTSALVGLVVGGGMTIVGSRARQGEQVPTRCRHCSSGCLLLAQVRDGRIAKLEMEADGSPPPSCADALLGATAPLGSRARR